jgi:hypothetical protein
MMTTASDPKTCIEASTMIVVILIIVDRYLI